MSEYADAIREAAVRPYRRENPLKLPQIDVCEHKDCPIHPKSENEQANDVRDKLLFRVGDYEVNVMCVFCIHAERKDMKEETKRAVLKHNLRKNGNRRSI